MNKQRIPLLHVTKGNADGSVVAGDYVWYGLDGSLNLAAPKSGSMRQSGWMDKEDLTDAITDFSY